MEVLPPGGGGPAGTAGKRAALKDFPHTWTLRYDRYGRPRPLVPRQAQGPPVKPYRGEFGYIAMTSYRKDSAH